MTTFFNILENFSANEREQIFREFLRNPGIFWLGQENTGNFESKNNLKGRDNNDGSRKATKLHEYVRRWQNEKQKYVPLFLKNSADRIFFSGKVPFLVRGTESGALEGRVGGESNLICLSPGESWLFFLDKLTTSLPFSSSLYHHLVAHPVPLCFWLSFLFTSPLAENLIERIKHHCL